MPETPAYDAPGPYDAPVIMSGARGSFARSVLAERHPALIRQVRDAFPYPPERQRALDALAEETEETEETGETAETADGSTQLIGPLPADAGDRERWEKWGAGAYVGRRSWFDVPFLWAESYFYRRLLEAVGYFAPGPWQGVDPFAPFKRAELTGSAVAAELAALDDLAALAPGERDQALLQGALWGNRADLGFRISSGERPQDKAAGGADGKTAGDADTDRSVLADDSAALWRHLDADPPGAVHVVADNAGRELILDLILIDHLLRTGRAATVVLHVKPYPYFVSDATTADVLDCLRRIGEAPGRAREIGARLWAAMSGGRLALRAHPFACAPLPYADLPSDLRADFGRATVTILKGDLNYRRLVGDRLHPPTGSFAAATSYFPGPVAALRTLKSDVIVGLDPRTLASLDATGETWRTSGTHAVIQLSTPHDPATDDTP